MKIWVVKVGEPVPQPRNAARLARSGNIAHTLATRGHDVVWWTSTFEHGSKQHVLKEGRARTLTPGLEVHALYAPGYRKHSSLRRLVHHWLLGRKFARAIKDEPPPDLILAAMPIPELAVRCTAYGARTGTPVVLDCRDMWPDIFYERVPRIARGLAKAAFWPMEAEVRRACHDATAILGHTPAFVEWGLRKGGRRKTWRDQAFPLAYSVQPVEEQSICDAVVWWKEQGVEKRADTLIACFVGTLTRHFELNVLADAIQKLREQYARIQVVVCGSGDKENMLRAAVGDDNRLVMVGWVGAPTIAGLLKIADVGLAPYKSSPSFAASIPNKAIEYLSAGLPIISSLQGTLAALIGEHGCGRNYPNGSAIALAHTLQTLAADRSEVVRMSAAASRLYSEQFDAAQVYSELCRHLERIGEECGK